MTFNEVLKTALPIIQKSAPFVASMLGSPAAGVGTSWAMSLLANAFGIKPAQIEDLSDTICNDPDAHNKLCNLEESFVHWFADNAKPTKPLSNAEVNIKLSWDNANTIAG